MENGKMSFFICCVLVFPEQTKIHENVITDLVIQTDVSKQKCGIYMEGNKCSKKMNK